MSRSDRVFEYAALTAVIALLVLALAGGSRTLRGLLFRLVDAAEPVAFFAFAIAATAFAFRVPARGPVRTAIVGAFPLGAWLMTLSTLGIGRWAVTDRVLVGLLAVGLAGAVAEARESREAGTLNR